MYKMKLVIGDWSDDGHGKSFPVLIECNHTVKEVQDAYKLSVIQTGLGFDGDDRDENGTRIPFERRICTGYEDYGTLSTETLDRLEQFGCPDELILAYQDDPFDKFTELWFWFVSLSLADIEYKVVKDEVPNINGYWDPNLNAVFGYGMFT